MAEIVRAAPDNTGQQIAELLHERAEPIANAKMPARYALKIVQECVRDGTLQRGRPPVRGRPLTKRERELTEADEFFDNAVMRELERRYAGK